MTFLQTYYFLLLIIPFVFFILFFILKNKWNKSQITWDLFKIFKKNTKIKYVNIFLITIILSVFTMLLANPSSINTSQIEKKNGIDIEILFDISYSMKAEDLSPNRLEIAKDTLVNFISQISSDRVGLTIFAGKPFTSVPLTFDYNILKENISSISTNKINQNIPELNWTAIWDALLMSNNLFKPSKEESKDDYKKREKVVLLLTDWDANVWVNPELAAKMLKDNNIKIYSIWIWSKVWWEISVDTWFWFIQNIKIPPLNEEKLKSLSQITSWEFFLAYNNEILSDIFKKLSTLEKNDISVSKVITYKQIYNQIIYINIILLFMFIILSFLKVNTKK